MSTEATVERQLGVLIATSQAQKEQMDRIEKTLECYAKLHGFTRDMVLEDRTTVRTLKRVVVAGVGVIGLLGYDWWHR